MYYKCGTNWYLQIPNVFFYNGKEIKRGVFLIQKKNYVNYKLLDF